MHAHVRRYRHARMHAHIVTYIYIYCVYFFVHIYVSICSNKQIHPSVLCI